ncbi:hypothetical protein [Actinokineospora enzanensis]|uniref:hypothetical protein n=1 Tax=Actinokineospora enzanensis TaxID=155975 RepID=UPI000382140E|nr:hypothetical protein [Actinokineospora enzanensis]
MTDLATHDRADRISAVEDPNADSSAFDVAISFADGRQGAAAALVEACEQRGLTVLHRPDYTHDWWASTDLPDARVRYFVPLVSAVEEFTEATLRAVKAGDEYVLPIFVGDVAVPAELLHPHVTYLRADEHHADRCVDVLATRVEAAEAANLDRTRLVDLLGRVKKHANSAGTPVTFSRYAEQDATLRYLGAQFAAALPGLDRHRFTGTVHAGDARIAVRVEQAGDPVFALDIQRGGIGGDETVNFVLGRHDAGSACSNGWARPVYDAEAGALLELRDLSLLGGGSTTRTLPKEELFTALWERLIEVITTTVR